MQTKHDAILRNESKTMTTMMMMMRCVYTLQSSASHRCHHSQKTNNENIVEIYVVCVISLERMWFDINTDSIALYCIVCNTHQHECFGFSVALFIGFALVKHVHDAIELCDMHR